MPRPRLFTDEERLERNRLRYHTKKATMTPEELAEFRKRHNQSRKKYVAHHHDEVRAKARAHAAQPEIRAHILAKQKAKWESDPEFWRAYGREAYLRNLPIHKAAQKRWVENNRPKTVQHAAKRRALKSAAPRNDLTHQQWLDIQAAQDHCCAYCGKHCKGRLTQDHITPLIKGGSHTLHNVIGACKPCNSKKRTKANPVPVQPLLL
jgi:5-methylcytosine-specific restriction endonuclease McrA